MRELLTKDNGLTFHFQVQVLYNRGEAHFSAHLYYHVRDGYRHLHPRRFILRISISLTKKGTENFKNISRVGLQDLKDQLLRSIQVRLHTPVQANIEENKGKVVVAFTHNFCSIHHTYSQAANSLNVDIGRKEKVDVHFMFYNNSNFLTVTKAIQVEITFNALEISKILCIEKDVLDTVSILEICLGIQKETSNFYHEEVNIHQVLIYVSLIYYANSSTTSSRFKKKTIQEGT